MEYLYLFFSSGISIYSYNFLRHKTIYANLGVITVISGFGYMMTQSLFAHHQAIIFLIFMTYIFMSQLNDRKTG